MRSSSNYWGTLVVLLLFVASGRIVSAEPDDGDVERKERPSEALLAGLSDDERAKLRSAVSGIWSSEDVAKRRAEMQEANLAYRKALQQEVRKMDGSPKVKAVLLRLLQQRFRQEGVEAPPRRGDAGERRHGGGRGKPLVYSEEERALIDSARAAAEKLPHVKAARKKLDGAVTARERNVASGEFRRVMREAMEKEEPRIKEIFGKRDRDARRR